MLSIIKQHLRISSSSFDLEIKQLINACIADLKIAGINLPSYSENLNSYGNSLIDSCIILYCKANFGLEYDEKSFKVYNHLKNTLVIGGTALE